MEVRVRRFHQMMNHRMTKATLTVLGMFVIFGGVLLVPSAGLQTQVMVVLAGALALEAGIWGLTRQSVPSERQFFELREEGDYLLALIRELNAAAVEKDRTPERGESQLQQVVALMHECVERMSEVAGKVSPQH